MQTNPAVEQSKIVRWWESPWNQSGRTGLLKSQVLSSEWNTERVRENASGDTEDGEDDEYVCTYVLVANKRASGGSCESYCNEGITITVSAATQYISHVSCVKILVNLFSTWRLHIAWMYYGECAHEQHLRRTLTLTSTLTLTHTITAYSISGKRRTYAHTHLCN